MIATEIPASSTTPAAKISACCHVSSPSSVESVVTGAGVVSSGSGAPSSGALWASARGGQGEGRERHEDGEQRARDRRHGGRV